MLINAEKDNSNSSEKVIDLFVPGRLCLFGEHSDWAGRFTDINADILPGMAIVTGINLGIYAKVKKSDKFKLHSIDEDGNLIDFECEMDFETLKREAISDKFFCYACGVAAYLIEDYSIGGIEIEIYKNTLPIKKGLSSSAAVCVLVARAFNEIYHLKLSTKGEMNVAYRGELLTSSRCGRLDQACAFGVRPVCMSFVGDSIGIEKLKVGKDLFLVFADLMSKKDTKRILSDLNKCYPFASSEIDKNVHDALGVDNHKIIELARDAIEKGDAEKLGLIMTESQKLFDEKIMPASPKALKSEKLHDILNDKKVQGLTFGGKGVGSHGDGSVQFIAKSRECQKVLVNYLNNEVGLQAYPFTIPARERIRKAIIPIAGFGTRMYPATRFIKKALMPVVDEDGFAKPVIMLLFEELDNAGIEEIILIVGEDERDEYEKIFSSSLSNEHISHLPEKVKGYEKLISRISKKIRYAVQKERRGFGHAVYQASKYLKREPTLLLLGDFIYKSNLSSSCVQQTMNAYTKSGGQLTIAIKPIPLNDVVHYGIVTGDFDSKRNYLMHVMDMVEKPSVDYAKDFLSVHTNKGDSYYATFGQYVLTPDVFDKLKEEISYNDKNGINEEISLTNALRSVCLEKGMTGVYIDGESYDVGIPKAYRDTIIRFGEK